ncbi:MAG: sodium:solute symporter [Sedimentisphaerales bacterium]|nr:sodium:solute symporter [Sedimentisphaerales bacterium]
MRLGVDPGTIMPQQTLHWIDWTIVLIYLGGILAIGWYFSHRQDSTREYFTANRSMPGPAVALSLMATIISSVTFLAYPGEAYTGNWIRLVQGLAVPLVLVSIIWFIVPIYRHYVGISAYEYFERRFGYTARLYSSLAFFVTQFTRIGSILYLLSLALAAMTGMNTYVIIVILGIVTTAYTLLGGIEAVIWTDIIQGIMLVAGGLIATATLLFCTPEGPIKMIQTAYQAGKISVGPFDWDFRRLTFWVMAINGIFYALQKHGTDQAVVQRFLTARSDRTAIRAALTGSLTCVFVWTLFMFIGSMLWAYYKLHPEALPATIVGDKVFPFFIMSRLPAGITGLILATLTAAAMSSLDSDINCLAAVAVEDFYRKLRPDSTDKRCLVLAKVMVLISGLFAMLIACIYVYLGGQAILGTIFALYAIFSGGIAGMFALGFLTTRANRRGLNIGIAACILFTAYAVLTSTSIQIAGQKRLLLDLGRWNFPHHNYMLGVYSHMVLFVVGYLASLLMRPDRDVRNLTLYGWLDHRERHKPVQYPGH